MPAPSGSIPSPGSGASHPRLSLSGITRRYGSLLANDGISLEVAPGEIHAVLGENGAGKSTLMKIIYGAVQPDAGELRWDGTPVRITSPRQARALGIAMVFQHFSLFDSLSVAENVWLGLDRGEPLARIEARIRELGSQYGFELDPKRPVHTLSVGEKQRVELTRALLTSPRLLILDEPTSVLTPQAVERLFDTLRQLASEGCSLLYISHKLHEIRSLCHACTVIRSGRVTGRVDPAQESEASLSRLMIGSEPPRASKRPRAPGRLALEVCQLQLARHDEYGVDLADIDLQVHEGEIVGIAGMSGSGQAELMAALSGEDPRAGADRIRLFGEPVGQHSPRQRRRAGLRFVPEERLGRGAVPALPLTDNLLLTRMDPDTAPGGWIRRGLLLHHTQEVIRRFGVRAPGADAPARSLSGGNLQKFIVGRELSAMPRVLLLAQPTWGVDVGAASLIRQEIVALRDAGHAVLVVSEELDELFEITDRLHVMAKGRLSPPVATADATIEQIGQWMSGLWAPEAGSRHAA